MIYDIYILFLHADLLYMMFTYLHVSQLEFDHDVTCPEPPQVGFRYEGNSPSNHANCLEL